MIDHPCWRQGSSWGNLGRWPVRTIGVNTGRKRQWRAERKLGRRSKREGRNGVRDGRLELERLEGIEGRGEGVKHLILMGTTRYGEVIGLILMGRSLKSLWMKKYLVCLNDGRYRRVNMNTGKGKTSLGGGENAPFTIGQLRMA